MTLLWIALLVLALFVAFSALCIADLETRTAKVERDQSAALDAAIKEAEALRDEIKRALR